MEALRCPVCNKFPRGADKSAFGMIYWHFCKRLGARVFWNRLGQYETTYKHLRNRMKPLWRSE